MADFLPLRIAVLTISDTRSAADDRSGDVLEARLVAAGHVLADRGIVTDDRAAIEARLLALAASDADVIVTTGGTGITGRDVTPEAVEAVCDKIIPGFGELFRWQSYSKIGAATIQSRALAGVLRGKLVFALPGSPSAVTDAWDGILVTQLDARTRPCNFATLLPRLSEGSPRKEG